MYYYVYDERRKFNMKIFNKEKGKEIVYVQREDLEYVLQYEKEIPLELIKRDIKRLVSQGLKEEFIYFEEPITVEFFKKLDWIIDYRLFATKSIDEIVATADDLFEKYCADIDALYNDIDKDRKYSKKDLAVLGQHYLNSMLAIPKYKNEDQFNFIPLVPDGMGFHYENNSICVSSTFKPNWFMVYSKNGRNIGSNKLPKDCLRALIAYFNGDTNVNWTWDLLIKEYPYITNITPEGKYILLGFFNPTPVKEKESISRLARVWAKNFNK